MVEARIFSCSAPSYEEPELHCQTLQFPLQLVVYELDRDLKDVAIVGREGKDVFEHIDNGFIHQTGLYFEQVFDIDGIKDAS